MMYLPYKLKVKSPSNNQHIEAGYENQVHNTKNEIFIHMHVMPTYE